MKAVRHLLQADRATLWIVDEENQQNGKVKIRLECKNILSTILGTKHGRFTSDSSFKRTSNNDRSMEFVAAMVTFNPKFGKEE